MTKAWEDAAPDDDHLETVIYRGVWQSIEQYRVTGEAGGLDAALRLLRIWREWVRLESEDI